MCFKFTEWRRKRTNKSTKLFFFYNIFTLNPYIKFFNLGLCMSSKRNGYLLVYQKCYFFSTGEFLYTFFTFREGIKIARDRLDL